MGEVPLYVKRAWEILGVVVITSWEIHTAMLARIHGLLANEHTHRVRANRNPLQWLLEIKDTHRPGVLR